MLIIAYSDFRIIAGFAFINFQICEATVPTITPNNINKAKPKGIKPTPEWKAKKLSRKLEIRINEKVLPITAAIPQIIKYLFNNFLDKSFVFAPKTFLTQ